MVDHGGIIRNIIGDDDDYEENQERYNKECERKVKERRKFRGV